MILKRATLEVKTVKCGCVTLSLVSSIPALHNHCNRPSHRNHRFLIIPIAVIIQSTWVSARQWAWCWLPRQQRSGFDFVSYFAPAFSFSNRNRQNLKTHNKRGEKTSKEILKISFISYTHKWKSYIFQNLSYWTFNRHQIVQKPNNSFMCKASTIIAAVLCDSLFRVCVQVLWNLILVNTVV